MSPDFSPAINNASHQLHQALTAFQAGRLDEATRLCTIALRAHPEHAPSLELFAKIQARRDELPAAVATLTQSIQRQPGDATLHATLGQLLLGAGKPDEAAVHLARAVSLSPAFTDAHALLGAAHAACRRPAEAVEAYRNSLAQRPDARDIRFNLGLALVELGQYSAAADCFRTLLADQPNDPDTLHSLGLCHGWLGELDEAGRCYEAGLAIAPEHVGNQNNLAVVYLAQGRLEEAMSALRSTAELKLNHGRPHPGPYHMLLHRVRHDTEQLAYLDAHGLLPEAYRDCLDALRTLEAAHQGTPGTERITVNAITAQRIAPLFNRLIYRADCERLECGALNPDIDWRDCELRYLNADPELVYIDGFLRPEALARLRHYCMASTVWKTPKPYGYLGALLADGFATPLLLQIITELRQRMPNALGKHPLAQAWAYKYDNTLCGINIHADCAAVNLNFWITPDSANLDPESGGLVLWDKKPPRDWGLMRTQNQDKSEILAFLESTGAKTITVPHRQNRMVMFHSALFHRTDHLKFCDGYENRRINLTLLYGNGLR